EGRLERLGRDRADDAPRDGEGPLRVRAREEEGELAARLARDERRALLARDGLDPPRDEEDHLVRGAAAVHVVQEAERVEVHLHDRERLPGGAVLAETGA